MPTTKPKTRAPIKASPPKSAWDVKQPGMYAVHAVQRNDNSGTVSETRIVIESAASPRDAKNQAMPHLNPNLTLIKFWLVFIGVLVVVVLLTLARQGA